MSNHTQETWEVMLQAPEMVQEFIDMGDHDDDPESIRMWGYARSDMEDMVRYALKKARGEK